MRQTIYDIVLIRLQFHQLPVHGRGVLSVLRRTRQTDTARHRMLLGMQVMEFILITECPARIPNKAVFDDSLLFRLPVRATR